MKWLLILLFFPAACQNSSVKNNANVLAEQDGLNRNPAHIHYSKHAKCRMDCRHIDEVEVKDILHNGSINFGKSELNTDPCHQKYAVEGYAKDQHLRIIFAPCGDAMTVVTCMDLANEWQCYCPGDH